MPSAQYQRTYRKRRKALGGARLTVSAEDRAGSLAVLSPPPPAADPIAALAAWVAGRLVTPPGHPRSGEPMTLPAFAVEFFAEALKPGIREAGLYCARKNGKSAILAALVLAHLAEDGPLRSPGWRAGVASINRDKAAELWAQARAIAEASGLQGIRFGKVPRLAESPWGKAEFLSADRSAGHAAGYDICVYDEIGLAPERGRDLAAGLLSSTSARDGRLIAISVIGDSPLSREMIERRDDPAVVVHVYQAPEKCALDDESAWRAANPGLGTIKSEGYMRDMARRAQFAPNEQANFRCYDLNQIGVPGREMIVDVQSWELVATQPRPERSGPFFVGLDAGGSASMTAAAIFWPAVGRLEVYGGYGDVPSLRDRGQSDGLGTRYCRMAERGELRTWPGKVTPVSDFIAWIAELLDGAQPTLALADRYRQGECEDGLRAAGVNWPMEWRAQGAGKDGSADVRAFQRAVLSRSLRPGENLLLASAIADSIIRYDGNGNPALDKARRKGRIDALSAAVLAVGAGERATARPMGAWSMAVA